jgi:hypothetical protein
VTKRRSCQKGNAENYFVQVSHNLNNLLEVCMKSHRLADVEFRSRCQAAIALLKHTKLSNASIARKCEISDSAVSIINKKYNIRPLRQYQVYNKLLT